MKLFKLSIFSLLLAVMAIPAFSFTISGGVSYTPNYGFGKNYYIKMPITDRISIMPLFVESEIHKNLSDYYAYSGYALALDYEIPYDFLSRNILSIMDYMFYSNVSLGYGIIRLNVNSTFSQGDSLKYQKFFNTLYLAERNGIDINSVFSLENVNYISVYRYDGIHFIISPSLNFSVAF